MRHPTVLLAASLLSGCSPILLAEPQILVSPYLAVYQLRGDTSLQSPGANPGDPPQDNAPVPMRTFGQDRFREDVGVRADLGDGFAGARVDYYRLDMNTARRGELQNDWGTLLEDDEVGMSAKMDELRLGWLEPIYDLRTELQERPLRVRLAAGGVFAYRDLTLTGFTDDQTKAQKVGIDGNVLYGAVRARATWREVSFDIDYAISPELVVSGDFEGVQQDIELLASYQLPQRDIRLFAGYRYSTLFAKGGVTGNLRYDADLIIDGFQFGVSVTF
jgi:hypothetical protein